MKIQLLSILIAMIALNASAQDLSFAFEGNDDLRTHLAELQGTSEPPELQLKDWKNSEPYTLEELKGKIVILDFWATWCGPCIASIPKNNLIAEKYKEDIVIIGICAVKGSEKMAKIVADKGIRYPVAIDIEGRTNDAYNANGYPDYYIIDKSGTLVVADCKNSKVEDVVKRLLKEKSEPTASSSAPAPAP